MKLIGLFGEQSLQYSWFMQLYKNSVSKKEIENSCIISKKEIEWHYEKYNFTTY